MSVNQLFSGLMNQLRESTLPLTYVILFNEAIYAKIDGKEYTCALNLIEYHNYKSLAHYLVFYSLKHGKKYNKANELCTKLLPLNVQEALLDKTIQELMEMSTKIYLQQLHEAVQNAKQNTFTQQWPEDLLVLVCGPASPRFGHPAMQYFARLTNKTLEQRNLSYCCCQGKKVVFNPADETKYTSRELFYIENAHSIEEALKIGATLLVEKRVMSRFADMSQDILAPQSMEYLQKVCEK